MLAKLHSFSTASKIVDPERKCSALVPGHKKAALDLSSRLRRAGSPSQPGRPRQSRSAQGAQRVARGTRSLQQMVADRRPVSVGGRRLSPDARRPSSVLQVTPLLGHHLNVHNTRLTVDTEWRRPDSSSASPFATRSSTPFFKQMSPNESRPWTRDSQAALSSSPTRAATADGRRGTRKTSWPINPELSRPNSRSPEIAHQSLMPLPRLAAQHGSPLFEDVCRHLVGGGSPVPTSVVRSMFFSKPANGGVTIDWHQGRRLPLAPLHGHPSRPAPAAGLGSSEDECGEWASNSALGSFCHPDLDEWNADGSLTDASGTYTAATGMMALSTCPAASSCCRTRAVTPPIECPTMSIG